METKARLALAPVPANQKLSLLGELGNLVAPVSNSRYKVITAISRNSIPVTPHAGSLIARTRSLKVSLLWSWINLRTSHHPALNLIFSTRTRTWEVCRMYSERVRVCCHCVAGKGCCLARAISDPIWDLHSMGKEGSASNRLGRYRGSPYRCPEGKTSNGRAGFK